MLNPCNKIEFLVSKLDNPTKKFPIFFEILVFNCGNWSPAASSTAVSFYTCPIGESVFSSEMDNPTKQNSIFVLGLKNTANSIISCLLFNSVLIPLHDDFISSLVGRYVLKRIRLAKHTEKSKLSTAQQEVGVTI